MCVHEQRENGKDNCHNDGVIKPGPDFCDCGHCCFYNCHKENGGETSLRG